MDKNEKKIIEIGKMLWEKDLTAATSGNISLKIDKNNILEVLRSAKGIPGRLELVIDKSFKVLVDYAHTPDQLEVVYKTLDSRLRGNDSEMICVLGSCGGGRDKWKRPELGKIAAEYCNKIIITNEDPYDENPSQILSEIKSGISNFQLASLRGRSGFPISNFYEILDRREAIKKAIRLARPDDIVIVTGKGSEPWMCVENNKKIPWDDRQIARDILSLK